jgi:hypothetical protein
MSILRATRLRLVGIGMLLLAPLAAEGAMHLGVTSVAPSDNLHPGDLLTIELALAATSFDTFEFVPNYDDVSHILHLEGQPAVAGDIFVGGFGLCNDGNCSFIYIPDKSVAGNLVATTWRFKVVDNAPPGPFDLNLNVFVGGSEVTFPGNVRFVVAEIPESSTWAFMLAGLAAVGARAYRRRMM